MIRDIDAAALTVHGDIFEVLPAPNGDVDPIQVCLRGCAARRCRFHFLVGWNMYSVRDFRRRGIVLSAVLLLFLRQASRCIYAKASDSDTGANCDSARTSGSNR